MTALTMVFSLSAAYVISYLCTVHCKNGSNICYLIFVSPCIIN